MRGFLRPIAAILLAVMAVSIGGGAACAQQSADSIINALRPTGNLGATRGIRLGGGNAPQTPSPARPVSAPPTTEAATHTVPNVQDEVKYMMQPELAPAGETAPQHFGAKDIFELSWKNLLDAYSCTECGRCSAACPANQTGKLLSPRKIRRRQRERQTSDPELWTA